MKKLLLLSVIGSSLLIGSNPAKADWDVWTIKNSGTSGVWDIYTLNSSTQEATKRTQVCTNNTAGCAQWYQIYVDPNSLNRLFVQEAMKQGVFPSWDYTPPFDASLAYVRGAIDPNTTATKARKRLPFVSTTSPDTPRVKN